MLTKNRCAPEILTSIILKNVTKIVAGNPLQKKKVSTSK